MKKSKIKQKRRRIALVIIILIVILIFYAIFHARDYKKEYDQSDYHITEYYNADLRAYTFVIQKEEKTWTMLLEGKYHVKKQRIEKIDTYESNDTICIKPYIDKETTYPQCLKDTTQIDYHLVDEDMKSKLDPDLWPSFAYQTQTYEKIDLKNMDENTYYIWNYKGFYKLNNKEKTNIPIFEKDIYDISNVAKIKNYLVIPNYNEDYYFNKFYLLNMKDNKVSTWEFKDSLYHDGYMLGTYKNSLYYVDKKTNTEWELVPKNKKMRKVGTSKKEGRVRNNNKWEMVSMNKLVNEPTSFQTPSVRNYKIDGYLYVTYPNSEEQIKVSSKSIKEIVATIKDKVYYIAGDTLYYYSEKTGEVEVISYFEWNFNFHNMVFIKEE